MADKKAKIQPNDLEWSREIHVPFRTSLITPRKHSSHDSREHKDIEI